jgi:hypothetical protein
MSAIVFGLRQAYSTWTSFLLVRSGFLREFLCALVAFVVDAPSPARHSQYGQHGQRRLRDEHVDSCLQSHRRCPSPSHAVDNCRRLYHTVLRHAVRLSRLHRSLTCPDAWSCFRSVVPGILRPILALPVVYELVWACIVPVLNVGKFATLLRMMRTPYEHLSSIPRSCRRASTDLLQSWPPPGACGL